MTYPTGTAALAIEIAKSEVGTIEEGDNLTKYGKFTKADGFRIGWVWLTSKKNSKV